MKKVLPSDTDIEDFVETVARVSLSDHAYNQYSYEGKHNDLRRRNLVRYLKCIRAYSPKVMLVGEAPGYRGSRLTGVPFCSERLIIEDTLFFKNEHSFEIEPRDMPISEMSASIVWKTLHTHSLYPLIWSSFPYHPHTPGNTLTNRAPTKEEVALGVPFITKLVELYGITHLVAVGRVAEKTLKELGHDPMLVRHPSHGGATLFAKGIADLATKII